MGILVSDTDFKGSYAIATDVYSKAELYLAVESTEELLLQQLLGVELYDLFIADLDAGVPQTQKYIDIYEAFNELIDERQVVSQGMKVMLCNFIYYNYVSEQSQNNSIGGNVQSQSTISSESKINYPTLVYRYNEAISTFNAIQSFIVENLTTYPEYKGIYKETMSWA